MSADGAIVVGFILAIVLVVGIAQYVHFRINRARGPRLVNDDCRQSVSWAPFQHGQIGGGAVMAIAWAIQGDWTLPLVSFVVLVVINVIARAVVERVGAWHS